MKSWSPTQNEVSIKADRARHSRSARIKTRTLRGRVRLPLEIRRRQRSLGNMVVSYFQCSAPVDMDARIGERYIAA